MNNYTDYLQHHGIKGQKWGIRRFQNKDGTTTDAGYRRYVTNPKTPSAKLKKVGGYDSSSHKKNTRKVPVKKIATTVAVGAGLVGGIIATKMLVDKIKEDSSYMNSARKNVDLICSMYDFKIDNFFDPQYKDPIFKSYGHNRTKDLAKNLMTEWR